MTIESFTEATEHLRQALEDVQRYTFVIQSLFERLEIPVFALDLRGQIVDANPAAVKLLGYRPDELHNQPLSAVCAEQGDACQTWLMDLLGDPSQAPPSWSGLLRRKRRKKGIPYHLGTIVLAPGANLDVGLYVYGVSEQAIRQEPERTNPAKWTLGNMPEMASTLPSGRRILGSDLDGLVKHLGQPTSWLCSRLGISKGQWYEWRNQPDQPIPNRSVALHLRLLDAFPMLVRNPSPIDLRHSLEHTLGRKVTAIELSLLLGMERTAGYRWARGSSPVENVQYLIATLMRFVETFPPQTVSIYRAMVTRQATLEGIRDLWEQQSWVAADGTRQKRR